MWTVEIQNIGGIRSGTTTIDSCLNVVQASNFQGKSSLISAIQTVMGSSGHYEDYPLTEGAESGSVTLETNDETYDVTIEPNARQSHSFSGSPYLTGEIDQKAARLFAFLGEDNPIRTAVRNGNDLTEYLQEPLNVEKIDRQINQLKKERHQLRIELEKAEKASERLPKTQEEVTRLEEEISELHKKKNELEEVGEAKEEADELSDELSDRRSSFENTLSRITQIERMIKRKEKQVEQKQEKFNSLETPDDVEELDNLEEKKERVNSLMADIDRFEDLYRVNKQILEDSDLDTLTDVERTISGDEIECWVCGSTAPKEEMESRIERIDDRVTELREQKQELNTEIKEFQHRKQEAEKKRKKYNRIKQDIKSLQNGIDEHRSQLDTLKGKKTKLQEEVEELEQELAEVEEEYSDELTDLKTEIRTKEQTLENKRKQLNELEAEKTDLASLRDQEKELNNEIEKLRNQKTETQHQLRHEFDNAIDEIIDRFAPGFESARLDAKTNEEFEVEEFELVIARDGQETSVDALSEGEVELIGVAVALAGYRVYQIDERVPMILIDGISQLASEHLRNLIEYIDDTAEIIVTTAYPEAGEFNGHIITPNTWDVVSDKKLSSA